MTTRNGHMPLPETFRTCPDRGITEKIPDRVIFADLPEVEAGAALEPARSLLLD